MKRLLLIGLLTIFTVGAHAADKKAVGLAKIAGDVRTGKTNVGKITNLEEDARYHNIHSEVLDMKCAGCHTNDAYPDDYLYLRKAEFPKKVGSEKVKAVERAKCIGCHSDGNVATAFYNKKK